MTGEGTSAGAGPLCLVGGGAWRDGCTFDRDLLARSGADEVIVLPTAAAYELPEAVVAHATSWFAALGARVRPVMVLGRPAADDPELAAVVRAARFVYLSGGSSLHLRSVLKRTALWQAIEAAWRDGAVLAASGAAAMVLGDPMVDPRGGAFTLGLGLVRNVAVLPHASSWSHDRLRRTTHLAPAGVALAALDESTALLRAPDGTWSVEGTGGVEVYVANEQVGLAGLPS